MKINSLKLYLVIFYTFFISLPIFANDYSDAENLINKANTASIEDESYDYLNRARDIYLKIYNENPYDIKAMVGLSKVNQLTGDRQEAKLYILKAYNTNPSDAYLQKEMGDFYYNFQEYSTAIEYYNLALASGLLKDFETNLQTARCYEKLGDLKNAELYYQVCNYLNPKSRRVLNKLNRFSSAKKPDNKEELENAKYKYLFKDKPLNKEEQTEKDADKEIEKLNGGL